MLFIPLLLLTVLLPILGGGAMLNEPGVAGLGGAMLNDEYKLLWGWLGGGGGAIEKLCKPLDVLAMDADAPHGFEDNVEEVDALPQSMPPPVFWLLYDGVVVGDIMLFMLMVGRCCC